MHCFLLVSCRDATDSCSRGGVRVLLPPFLFSSTGHTAEIHCIYACVSAITFTCPYLTPCSVWFLSELAVISMRCFYVLSVLCMCSLCALAVLSLFLCVPGCILPVLSVFYLCSLSVLSLCSFCLLLMFSLRFSLRSVSKHSVICLCDFSVISLCSLCAHSGVFVYSLLCCVVFLPVWCSGFVFLCVSRCVSLSA